MTNPDGPIKATTQEHLDIYTIKDDFIVLKDGSVALVLKVSAINFSLFSEEEQDALIYSYASLLNSLTFPIQILIRSSRKDITAYLDLIDQKLQETQSQKIKEQIIKYRSFVKSMVKKNRVLEKKFYLVIPFSFIGFTSLKANFNPFATAPQKPPYEMKYIIQKAKTELYPRRDHLVRQLSRLGLLSSQLSTQQLVTLFYKTYNPTAIGVEQTLTVPQDYETPTVEAKENDNPSPEEETWAEEAAKPASNNLPKPPSDAEVSPQHFPGLQPETPLQSPVIPSEPALRSSDPPERSSEEPMLDNPESIQPSTDHSTSASLLQGGSPLPQQGEGEPTTTQSAPTNISPQLPTQPQP